MTSVHPPDDVRIFVRECRTLAAADYDVTLIAPGARDCVRDGVRVLGVPAARSLGRTRRMTATVLGVYRRARALRADLYHFHDPELMPAGLLLARTGARVIYDAHEDLAATVLDKPWIAPALRRPAARVAARAEPAAAGRLAAVVAATPAIAERFEACRCIVATVNNYPEPGEFGAVQRRADGGEPVVCYVGALTPIRGADTMVAAVGRSGVRLLLAGAIDPPDMAERLRALPGWSCVEHLGPVDRRGVADVFARAIAGVVVFAPAANHVRSQPTKLFEYMAAGLAVVASDFPHWRDIVEGSGCGLCVDPTSVQALADAIGWLVANPDAARAMGADGRRAVRETYTWANEARTLTALYEELLR